MKTKCFTPNSLRSAARVLRFSFSKPLLHLTDLEFTRVWSVILYLFPGLHPDGFDDSESGWPRVLKPFAAEAWRRFENGKITEEELYPSDSQWCGLYDRMHTHEPDEIYRRLALAADYGESLCG